MRPAFLLLGTIVTLRLAATPTPDVHLFVEPSAIQSPVVSPDGRSISFIAPQSGHARLFKLDRTSGQISGLFDPGEGQVRLVQWVSNAQVLFAGKGSRGLVYFLQAADGSPAREVRALRNVPWGALQFLPGNPRSVVLGYFGVQQALQRLDLATGRLQRIEHSEMDAGSYVLTRDAEVRATFWREKDKWRLTWRVDAKSPWQKTEGTGEPPFRPVALAANGRDILGFAYDRGDTVALMALDPTTGERTVVAQKPDRDIAWIRTDPPHFYPTHLGFFSPGKHDVQYLDPETAALHATLERSLPGRLHRIASASDDGTVQVVQTWRANQPAEFYVFDSARKSLTLLGAERPALDAAVLVEPRLFKFKARDGVEEYGWIVLPSSGAACPPLVIFPSPTVGAMGDSGLNYDAWVQFMASRGFAVAKIFVRGTYGLGRAWEKAGDFELTGKMTEDLEDGIRFLAAQKLVDENRIGCVGIGVSGLVALRLASTSTLFKAVAAYDAYPDLTANDISLATSATGSLTRLVEQAGSTADAFAQMHRLHPETYIAGLQAPALLAYPGAYGVEFSPKAAGIVRDVFRSKRKTYEWWLLDFRDFDKRASEYYVEQLYVKIADFFDHTFAK